MIPLKDDTGQRRRFPFITYTLIAINIVVFLLELNQGPQIQAFIFAYSLVPAALTHNIPQTILFASQLPQPFPYSTPSPVWLTLFTSMFMHAGWLHIGGNMLFLYIFGDNVEDRMGHLGYLLFYLLCGIVAALAQTFVDPNSTIPSLGASGAIAGVLAAYAVFFPGARVTTLIFLGIFVTITRISALILIGLWFALQFFDGVASLSSQTQQAAGGVAYFAHIGGFVAGLLIALLLRPFQNPPQRRSTYPRWPPPPNTRW
ncbi:MAG TPA: rhomboid family intramembrane serine protease [Ktedonobacterales bacterium]